MEAFNNAKKHAEENRARLKEKIENALEDLDGFPVTTKFLFDKPHNDIEIINNENKITYKFKKGTSSLNNEEIFVIPGTCTDPSYIVKGQEGLIRSHNTINHGAGRKYTRAQLFSKYRRTNFDNMFRDIVLNVDTKKMIEEIPKGYKNIEDVITSAEEKGLIERIAKLKPVGVVVDRK